VTTATATLDAKERRTMAAVLLVAALLIVAYWTAWLVHRSVVASETGAAYTQFEDASRWPTAGWPSAWWPRRTAS
jgi:hypothetical protein